MLILAGGAIVTGYAGFGFNLITVPVLTIVLGPTTAILATLMVGACLSGIMTWQNRKEVPWGTTALLLCASLPGVWVGTALASHLSATALQRMVGAAVLVSAAVLTASLRLRSLRRSATKQRRGWFGWSLAGLISGVMVAGAGMSGPAIVWMHSWRGDTQSESRASTLAYVTAVSGAAALLIALSAGNRTNITALMLAGLSIPTALVGLWAGAALFRRHQSAYAGVAISLLALAGGLGVVLSVVAS